MYRYHLRSSSDAIKTIHTNDTRNRSRKVSSFAAINSARYTSHQISLALERCTKQLCSHNLWSKKITSADTNYTGTLTSSRPTHPSHRIHPTPTLYRPAPSPWHPHHSNLTSPLHHVRPSPNNPLALHHPHGARLPRLIRDPPPAAVPINPSPASRTFNSPFASECS